MSDLDDDIARIAALRGRPANYYHEAATSRRSAFVIDENHIACVFSASPNVRSDLRAHDGLPAAIKAFVAEAPLQLNAGMCADLLQNVTEERLITTVQAHMPGQLRAWVLKHYGRDHPSARRLS